MREPQGASNRILLNTGAQYARSVINIFVSLYSARLILNALGVNDYGIYSLIAGVVSLLSFLSASLVITTQRFISFHQGKGNAEKLRIIFSNSLYIHFGLSIIVILLLEALSPFLFGGFLNISPDRLGAAKIVYQCVVGMVTISLLSSPFKALLISHENIVYTSITEIFSCFIKLGIAIWLTYFGNEKLILYASLLMIISIFEALSYIIYDFIHYPECSIPKRKHIDKTVIRSMFGFAGWTLWSQGCIIGRVQGVSIVVNKFFGTVINAAYGIGMQVNGAISFISASISNAFSPQIVKAAGCDDRQHMFHLATLSCKYSFLLSAAVVVPLFVFCPLVLHLWLGVVPEYATLFCRIILLSTLVDLSTMGLGTANQALGNIRNYSIYLNSLKLLTIPIIICGLLLKIDLKYVMWTYPLLELTVAMIRLPFLKASIGLDVTRFVKSALIPISIPTLVICVMYHYESFIVDNFFKLVISVIITTLCYLSVIYLFSMSKAERDKIRKLLLKFS